MTGRHSAEYPNMAQRTVMQYLSLDDWKIATRLPIPAGELMLSRMRNYGWIEIRGETTTYGNQTHPGGAQGYAVGHLKPSAGFKRGLKANKNVFSPWSHQFWFCRPAKSNPLPDGVVISSRPRMKGAKHSATDAVSKWLSAVERN